MFTSAVSDWSIVLSLLCREVLKMSRVLFLIGHPFGTHTQNNTWQLLPSPQNYVHQEEQLPFKQRQTQLVLTKILLPPPSQVRRRPVEGPPRSAQLPPQTQMRRNARSARNHLVLSKILLPPPSQVRRRNLGGLARIAQLPPPSQLGSRRNQQRRRRMLRILKTSLKTFHS
jgi:hypothetical protein